MICRNIAGVPRPVGSSFDWRRIYAPRTSKDDHNVPWIVSKVDSLNGPVIEAKFHLDHYVIVATDIAHHTLFESDVLLREARRLLDEDGWTTGVVRPCAVEGCENPLPMWTCTDSFQRADKTAECLSCSMRSVKECVECGMPDPANYISGTRERMLRDSLCFGCELWRRRTVEPPEIVTEDYGIYSIGSGRGPKSCHGFGGAEFVVTFFDGRVVNTDDLWSGGTAPEWFHDRFTPNAVLTHRAVQPLNTPAASRSLGAKEDEYPRSESD